MSGLGIRQAQAHPHVFVEARSKLIFDDRGVAVAIDHVFRFDDAYTAFALQGFDKNGDGKYSRDELKELADVNIDSMKDFGYFTFGDNTKVELDFNRPEDGYWLEVVTVPVEDYWALSPQDLADMREDAKKYGSEELTEVQLLELHFRLPLKQPTDASKPITLDVYDPTYYVDFRFSRAKDALGVVNPPVACTVTRKDPPPLDAATQYALSQVGADQRELPADLQWAGQSQVNQMIVDCPGAPVVAVAQTETQAAPAVTEAKDGDSDPLDEGVSAAEIEAAKEAVTKMATQNGNDQGAPSIQRPSTAVSVISPQGLFNQFFATIAELQAEFYQKLVNAMRSFRTNPYSGLWLIGLSFVYGIFHAAGPGHGKAIISSYLVANNETLKKGILLSFVSSMAQAVTAIVLVGGLAILFNMTSIAIQDTARWLEIGSYLFVTLLGLSLIWRVLRRYLPGRASGHDHDHGHGHGHHDHAGHSHTHHDHGHIHDHHDHHHHEEHGHGHHEHHREHDHIHLAPGEVCSTCGHAHAPSPDMLTGKMSLKKMISVVLAVGLRPCSGALIVLVFAIGQGMVGAAIAATFVMALGTGITVSVLATLAVTAKDVALRLFGREGAAAGRVLGVFEFGGALVIFLMGLTLLTATIGWGA